MDVITTARARYSRIGIRQLIPHATYDAGFSNTFSKDDLDLGSSKTSSETEVEKHPPSHPDEQSDGIGTRRYNSVPQTSVVGAMLGIFSVGGHIRQKKFD